MNAPTPPMQPGTPAQPPIEGDKTGGIIPYKNPRALAAYYMSIGGLIIPLLGIVALIFGILGWRDYRRNPVIRGQVHAWIGIILGAIGGIFATLCVGSMIVAMIWGAATAASRSGAPAAATQDAPASDAANPNGPN